MKPTHPPEFVSVNEAFQLDRPCPWLTAGYILWVILGSGFIVLTVWAMAWADKDMHGFEPEPKEVPHVR